MGAAEYPFMEQHFATRASMILQLLKVPDGIGLSIRLAPLARTVDVFPLAGSEGVIGGDSFDPCQVRCCSARVVWGR